MEYKDNNIKIYYYLRQIMPEPDNSLFSTDYYLYKYIYNPLAKKLNFLYPNTVTVIGTLITIPMALNLLYNGNFNMFIFMGLFRTICDCLDGALARVNNQQTRLGGILDILNDSIFTLCLGSISIYKLLLKNYICSSIVIFILIVYAIRILIKELKGVRTYENMFISKYDKFFHDNTTIISVFIFYYIKKVI